MKFLTIAVLCCTMISPALSADEWQVETVDSSNNTDLHSPSLAMDAEDNAHISYQECILWVSADLMYAYNNGSSWDISIVDSSVSSHGLACRSSIALSSGVNAKIAYTNNDNGFLKYASWNGSSWDVGVVDGLCDGLNYVSLCLDDGDDPPSIAYGDNGTTGQDLMYARFESQWLISAIEISGDVGYYVSMALDSYNTPHVSYYAAGLRNLKYAVLGPEFWQISTVESSGDVGMCNSIAIDSNDRPHISYYGETSGNLKYAYYDGSSWNISVVETTGNVGLGSSIAVDSNNHPHISYFDGTNDCLKYAYHNGSTWELSVVDAFDEDADLSSSIALDSEDRPHISFAVIDGGYYLLRYAYYGPVGIEEEEGGYVEYALSNVIPNPSAGSANVSFSIPVSCDVNLDVFDITGRKVAELADGVFSSGMHETEINGLTSGIYFCTLRTGAFVDTKTLVVIK